MSEAELIASIVQDDMFPLAAAQEAFNVPTILTAATAHSFYGTYNVSKTEEEVSHYHYEKNYCRAGMLRALAAEGVVHIPTSQRNVVNEAIGTDYSKTGLSILKLFRDMRRIRSKG